MIHVDHYMCRPVSPFDDPRSETNNKPVSKVPVIRVFGADHGGHKICLHIHGFYPYLAIQNPEPQNSELARKIVSDIEAGLLNTVNQNQDKKNRQQSSSNNPGEQSVEQANLEAKIQQERPKLMHLSNDQKFPVHKIEPIRSFNYYGYHNQAEDFFKIHLYNPRMVKQLAIMFEHGHVLQKFVPVFWAHLPYILLFFIDNNLRGMQFIDVDQVYWRKGKGPKFTSMSNLLLSYTADSPKLEEPSSDPYGDKFSDDSSSSIETNKFETEIDPISTCEYEGDIRYEWISNRKKLGTKGNDDALKELWLDDQEASQTSSTMFEPKLPLYSLELNYLKQLCDSYDVDDNLLTRDITLAPSQLEPASRWEPITHGGDDSDSNTSSDISREMYSHVELSPQRATISAPRNKAAEAEKVEKVDIKPSDVEPAKRPYSDNSMIDGTSMLGSSTGGPSGSQRSGSSSRDNLSHEYQYLCLMSMELHVSTRGELRPDPMMDTIEAVFYCIENDVSETSDKPQQAVGLIITDPMGKDDLELARNLVSSPGSRSNASFAQKVRTMLGRTGLTSDKLELNVVDNELELIIRLVEVVKYHDPEILVGYETEQLSWGYFLERANNMNVRISLALSRITETRADQSSNSVESSFVQPIMFTGRMVFSTWRIIKHEIHLNTCSYEKIHHHALHERVPCFSFRTLTDWFNEDRNRWRVIDYYLTRVVGQMRILAKFDLITKVSELARVYGTQFIDVITRGSQIGIESMMLRLAKLQNLTPLSPTVMQRHKMLAPESIPLVMEPETNIYYDPVAVLDFASLYPSVVIAYNYCYSTCLGRVMSLETKQPFHFGCSHLNVESNEVKRLLEIDGVHVSPCGVAFVKKSVRHGVLPKMLSELIVTRAMVKDQMKKNMKSAKPNRRLQRVLEHRQHGLKMMANTTYGYTGASYTGRMPCVEIADSIVSKGRETLENAIELVESKREWGAKVIYGDTDSLFIQFKDCDRDTAFKRSMEMVDAITKANPYPIKMKFEKIYQPCVLQTKKRYCGFKWESPEQTKPVFETKGMEIIRRDCCPAAARMLEMALRIQFTTKDIDQVRRYVQEQFLKIQSGKLSNLQDFIFARQYKPRDLDKSESVFVPAWQIAKRFLAIDPRAEPRVGERVPFVIIYGESGTPLVKLAKTPIEMLQNLSFRINADYYIQKIICPTLNRVFCTMKVDTLVWYKSMPHRNILHRSHYLMAQKSQRAASSSSTSFGFGAFGGQQQQQQQQSTMSHYFSPSHCAICAKSILAEDEICSSCQEDMQLSVIRLSEEINRSQRKMFALHQLCRACSSLERCASDSSSNNNNNPSSSSSVDDHYNPCISYDCPNLFRYHQAKLDSLNSNYLANVLKGLS